MKRTDEVQGRRLPDVALRDHHETLYGMRPGDYVRILDYPGPFQPSNLTREVWFAITPNGLLANLGAHTVREEEDGSITVKPGDGSSNSILVSGGSSGKTWHGHITRGLWWSLA